MNDNEVCLNELVSINYRRITIEMMSNWEDWIGREVQSVCQSCPVPPRSTETVTLNGTVTLVAGTLCVSRLRSTGGLRPRSQRGGHLFHDEIVPDMGVGRNLFVEVGEYGKDWHDGRFRSITVRQQRGLMDNEV